jgi:hypothetical protein
MHNFKTSAQKRHSDQFNVTCIACRNADEDVLHVLFQCPQYKSIRDKFYNSLQNIKPFTGTVCNLSNDNLILRIVLNIDPFCQFPDSDICIRSICQFVNSVYLERTKVVQTTS